MVKRKQKIRTTGRPKANREEQCLSDSTRALTQTISNFFQLDVVSPGSHLVTKRKTGQTMINRSKNRSVARKWSQIDNFYRPNFRHGTPYCFFNASFKSHGRHCTVATVSEKF